MIFAPEPVVSGWRNAAARCLDAGRRGADPVLAPALARAPRHVQELVAYLSDTLAHTSGVLLASAVNATPGAPAAFQAGLAELAKQVTAEIERDRAAGPVDPGAVCPLPQTDGAPFVCGCGPVGRESCETLALDVDLEAVAADDRAGREPAGDNGCEGGTT